MNRLESIQKFLQKKRIALVGVSRAPADFTRVVFGEFVRRGYDAFPVNPSAQKIDDVQVYARLEDVPPPVEAVLIMTNPSATKLVAEACVALQVPLVWMHRGAGQGSVDLDAAQNLRNHGIEVIAGECPMMFLPDTAWFHRFHGFLRKVTGAYPERTSSPAN